MYRQGRRGSIFIDVLWGITLVALLISSMLYTNTARATQPQPTISLDRSSDSGVSSIDRMTNDATPNTDVQFFADNVAVTVIARQHGHANVTARKVGNGTVTLGRLAEGVWEISATDGTTTSSPISVTIDTISPVVFVANANSGMARSKTVSATVREEHIDTFGFNNTAGTCDEANAAGLGFTGYTAGDDITLDLEHHNGTRICFKVSDRAGNTTYTGSRLISGIDTTDPVIKVSDVTPREFWLRKFIIFATVEEVNRKTFEYAISETSSCDSTITGFSRYAEGTKLTFDDTEDNGKVVCFRSSDFAGNVSLIPVPIPLLDLTPPTIVLHGDNPLTITVNGYYDEYGASIVGDTRDIIIDDSDVNVDVVGEYAVTYTTTDLAGNTGTATRTVIVVDKPAPALPISSLMDPSHEPSQDPRNFKNGYGADFPRSTLTPDRFTHKGTVYIITGLYIQSVFGEHGEDTDSIGTLFLKLQRRRGTRNISGAVNPAVVLPHGSITITEPKSGEAPIEIPFSHDGWKFGSTKGSSIAAVDYTNIDGSYADDPTRVLTFRQYKGQTVVEVQAGQDNSPTVPDSSPSGGNEPNNGRSNSSGSSGGRSGGGGAPITPFSTPQVEPLTQQPPVTTVSTITPQTPSTQAFTRSLTVGATGEDVRALQQLLNQRGFTVSETGPGSPGQESTYFGERTRQAVARYQEAHDISPTAGYFGPITRASLQQTSSATETATTEATTQQTTPRTTESATYHLGNQAPRIRAIQVQLNQTPCPVATEDAGSLGQETTYFGQLTLQAVNCFRRLNNMEENGEITEEFYETLFGYTKNIEISTPQSRSIGTTQTPPGRSLLNQRPDSAKTITMPTPQSVPSTTPPLIARHQLLNHHLPPHTAQTLSPPRRYCPTRIGAEIRTEVLD